MKKNKIVILAGCGLMVGALVTGSLLFSKTSNVSAKDEEPVVIEAVDKKNTKPIPHKEKYEKKEIEEKEKDSIKDEAVLAINEATEKVKASSDIKTESVNAKVPENQQKPAESKTPIQNTPESKPAVKTGHYENKWIEDYSAYDEEEYKTVSYFVCNGCGSDFGTDEAALDAHGREAMLSGNYSCGSWKTLYKSVPTGNKIHHDAVGHYEKVWVSD